MLKSPPANPTPHGTEAVSLRTPFADLIGKEALARLTQIARPDAALVGNLKHPTQDVSTNEVLARSEAA